MTFLRSVLSADHQNRDVLTSTARNIMAVTGGLYLVWHIVATLGWPRVFSPRLWITSIEMATILVVALRLNERRYLAAQLVWLLGLAALIFQASALYQRSEIMGMLVFLPLMAIVTLGLAGSALYVIVLAGLAMLLPRWGLLPAPPAEIAFAVVLGSLFTLFFGWSISSNLLDAIEASSYHYHQARQLLDETRQHRAEISRMLKEQSQANYQLDRLNQTLASARRQAEEARNDRDRFILAVSHELRSPLNFIIGFTDLMVDAPETYAPLAQWPAGLHDDVQEIYRSSAHLMRLINDILDMGRLDAHQMTVFREYTRVEALVEEVVEMVRQAYERKGLSLRIELQAGLPPVYVDCTRIRQVLLNILNNSLRFTEQGGVVIRAALVGKPGEGDWAGDTPPRGDFVRGDFARGDFVRVEIEDSGAGIAPEDAAKVFDEFRQVGDESWRRREGSGLGLAISRRFIELHGGTMGLESEAGRGTRIFFTLPVHASLLEAEGMPPGRAFAAPVRQEPLVLLFTANPMAPKFVGQCIDRYQVVASAQLSQAAALAEQYYPRAILVDRALDEELSIALLPYPLPVIYFSLPNDPYTVNRLPESIANYLVKPVSRQMLLAALEQLGAGIRTILVVDDDPAMVRFVAQVLVAPGSAAPEPKEKARPAGEAPYRVLTAFSGQDALQQIAAQPVDAVLMDLSLPDMEGWQVLAEIRRQDPLKLMPVIIVSATDLPHALFSGGLKVLDISWNRPLTQGELTTVLPTLLETLQPTYPPSSAAPPSSPTPSPLSPPGQPADPVG